MLNVIDAHVLIWYLEDSPKLSAAAGAVIDDPASQVIVPTIILAEIAHRHGRGRSPVSLADVRALIDGLANATVAPFDVDVLNLMPVGLEIHDAIVVATARAYSAGGARPVRVVTHDRQITDSRVVDVLW